jgi:type IV secretion system protein VirB9
VSLLHLAALVLAAGQPVPTVAAGPSATPADPRVQVLTYAPDQVFRLGGAAGYQTNIEFAADETIENVAIGDSGAWQATANRRGDRLFVKPLQGGVGTNMTVVTNVRVYLFELTPSSDGIVPFTLRFRYPETQAAAADDALTAPEVVAGRYRLSGTRSLFPSRMWDDGLQTFIDFPPDASIPAIYVIDARGQETLVNGGMRGGLFVVDSVPREIVFRIDEHLARATRITPTSGRRARSPRSG